MCHYGTLRDLFTPEGADNLDRMRIPRIAPDEMPFRGVSG